MMMLLLLLLLLDGLTIDCCVSGTENISCSEMEPISTTMH